MSYSDIKDRIEEKAKGLNIPAEHKRFIECVINRYFEEDKEPIRPCVDEINEAVRLINLLNDSVEQKRW